MEIPTPFAVVGIALFIVLAIIAKLYRPPKRRHRSSRQNHPRRPRRNRSAHTWQPKTIIRSSRFATATPDNVEFIIDGSNIINFQREISGASLKYLLAITNHLEATNRPYLAFFDATAPHILPREEVQLYRNLLEERSENFKQVPGGTCADDFILRTASDHPNCKVITNDRYRDHVEDFPWVKETPHRLVKGMVCQDKIYFPSIKLTVEIEEVA